jgi:hypothetical protein
MSDKKWLIMALVLWISMFSAVSFCYVDNNCQDNTVDNNTDCCIIHCPTCHPAVISDMTDGPSIISSTGKLTEKETIILGVNLKSIFRPPRV